MLNTLLAFALAFAPALQQTDTTLSVRPGGRLVLDGHGASASIRVWDRDALRIQATHGAGVRIGIRERAGTVAIDADRRSGGPASGVHYDITLPQRFDVAIDGVNVVATIDGLHGAVRIDNVEGAITLRNVTGSVDVESVSGSVTLDNVQGNVRASSVNQRVLLASVRATSIEVETVQGTIVMQNVDATTIEASTVNGTIEFDGAIRDAGRYYFGTHNGRIVVTVPEQTGATFAISTRNGTIDTAFPVTIRNTRDRDVTFVLGSGSARVEIESFNGRVQLIRPRGR